jgi:hypothetical protein
MMDYYLNRPFGGVMNDQASHAYYQNALVQSVLAHRSQNGWVTTSTAHAEALPPNPENGIAYTPYHDAKKLLLLEDI